VRRKGVSAVVEQCAHEVSFLITRREGSARWRGVSPRSKVSMMCIAPPQQAQARWRGGGLFGRSDWIGIGRRHGQYRARLRDVFDLAALAIDGSQLDFTIAAKRGPDQIRPLSIRTTSIINTVPSRPTPP
jgi:hypothetical protein